MKTKTMLFALGVESGKSLTDHFTEHFWKIGICPVTRGIRIVTSADGNMEVRAKGIEIDGSLLDRMTIWDLQSVVDGIGAQDERQASQE